MLAAADARAADGAEAPAVRRLSSDLRREGAASAAPRVPVRPSVAGELRAARPRRRLRPEQARAFQPDAVPRCGSAAVPVRQPARAAAARPARALPPPVRERARARALLVRVRPAVAAAVRRGPAPRS